MNLVDIIKESHQRGLEAINVYKRIETKNYREAGVSEKVEPFYYQKICFYLKAFLKK